MKRKVLSILLVLVFMFSLVYFSIIEDHSTEVHASVNRLGLHVTQGELDIWRLRKDGNGSYGGPYKTAGDVQANSPGDWDRIESNALNFKNNPLQAIWDGPVEFNADGSVKQIQGTSPNNPPKKEFTNLRDAAFYYLVTGDTEYRNAVKYALLEQIQKPKVDFSDTTLYPGRQWKSGGSPYFDLANWVTKLLYSYDYLTATGNSGFSAAERDALNDWFYYAANFFRAHVNINLGKLFVDRWNGDYTPTSIGSSTAYPDIVYMDINGTSKPIYTIARYYNNRVACGVRAVATVTQKLLDEGYIAPTGVDPIGNEYMSLADLKKTAKQFVKEWLIYSFYPDEFFGEFQRWTSSNPELGVAYAANLLGPILTTVDVFGRAGDTELYTYSTREGVLGTECGVSDPDKTILWAVKILGKYAQQYSGNPFGNKRYGTDNPANLNINYLIDYDNPDPTKKDRLEDILAARVNVYYKDDYLKGIYQRTNPGVPAYSVRVTSEGQHSVFLGDWGSYPATLFMFGQMEDYVDPYGGAPPTPAPTTPAPPTPTPGGGVLLDEDFNDGVADNWIAGSGTWAVSGGQYLQTATSARSISAYSNGASWSDYTYSANVKASNQEGIIFRCSSNMQNYYVMRRRNASTIQLGKVTGGSWSPEKTYSFNTVAGQYYKFTAILNGSNITLKIGDTVIATETDTSFSIGTVGLYTYQCAADFDNVLVTE